MTQVTIEVLEAEYPEKSMMTKTTYCHNNKFENPLTKTHYSTKCRNIMQKSNVTSQSKQFL